MSLVLLSRFERLFDRIAPIAILLASLSISAAFAAVGV
jgi:hypothetical protein